MANSIVFQNSAEELKSSIYGYDSASKSYQPIKVNGSGELEVTIGTIPYLNQVATIKYVAPVGTLNYVAPIGTLKYVNQVATIKYVAPVGTLNYVAPIGTLKYVNQVATIKYVAPVGTLNYIAPIGTLKYVNQVATIKYVAPVGTLNYVAPIGTLKYINQVATIKYVGSIVKTNVADRYTFTSTQTLLVTNASPSISKLINISKYQDASWYVMNTTSGGNKASVTVQLSATPSFTTSIYPLTLIDEKVVVNGTPQLITNNRYTNYIAANIKHSSANAQTIVLVFTGRY